eukprot:501964-Prymnesium_polylepis.2
MLYQGRKRAQVQLYQQPPVHQVPEVRAFQHLLPCPPNTRRDGSATYDSCRRQRCAEHDFVSDTGEQMCDAPVCAKAQGQDPSSTLFNLQILELPNGVNTIGP